jgi:hypothetical protein
MTLKTGRRKTTVPRTLIRKAVEKVYALRFASTSGNTKTVKPSAKKQVASNAA